ncbi:sirohydrochlorin chelatase [Pseudoclavibacter endophyticus]|uniref:Cobalamin biosynthesis protein CbiX n=1 Tax=Pseudoclavibacter endophyticus TaxID=1778590 RepID=A0A6H9WA97_9MICO|nr:CbiX/SirB N-terminal domain-containing protein [Pseudoclavibacter endophyticus]KAB1646737.1 cobalamin biosynthesis protein CbiX [Pseudoclavibacter endophyticus]
MTLPSLLLVSHGTASPTGQRAVAGLVAAVAERLPGFTVQLAHVDVQQPDVERSLAFLSHSPVVVVPALLSAGYHVHVDLERETRPRADVVLADSMGPDGRLAEVLDARLDQAGFRDEDDEVVLAVAGSSDERANEDCRAMAAMLSHRLGRNVTVGFLSAAEPRLDEAIERASRDGRRVIVSTYLLAPGYFHDLTVRLAGGAPVAAPLLGDDAPAFGLVDLVIDRFEAAWSTLAGVITPRDLR